MGPQKGGGEGRTDYIDAGGYVHESPSEAISASLGFESVSGTGAGCSQSPDNVSDDGDSASDNGSSDSDGNDE